MTPFELGIADAQRARDKLTELGFPGKEIVFNINRNAGYENVDEYIAGVKSIIPDVIISGD